ncbi:HD domain-containing protein [Alicyclobacillus cycloheptanicus]|uniref:HD superfamily phosphohydrolase n=1 Tax=Alicyclobacillus cycloheptanicus TaxID=1457 RepID=A0ABT9XFC6_9BACL|nr:HD domain-containing protein [Alicyclobacillus cycloheptanicus]MDQ0188998.1 HD superfamily phosphohydrolase [Alicyclobacillus cycloheptanicus]WDM01659.1 HD domain-containing protein [Alicyclobacillus cycloheptanicus]
MGHFEKVLKDPVHDEILVDDPWVWRLVNSAAVQRLRRIRQLGTSYLTFHGAEHSRFTHSLGAYETMRRVLIHLQRECGWPADERDRKLALSAALLHDVGHGPFSHTFESIYPVHHEQWTRRILQEDDEMQTILAEIDDEFANDLVGILQKAGRHPMVEQLITSQLDVDRMDYLLRDALNTGVSYGRFELARLLRSLTISDGQILLRANALHTVEQYILARYFMYAQVYLHPVTVGSDVLVLQILRRAGDLIRDGKLRELPQELLAIIGADEMDIRVSDYLALDESTLLYAFRQWSRSEDSVLADLSQRFLHRRLFAPITRTEPNSEEWAILRTAARALGFHPDYYVSGRTAEISGYVYRGEGILLLRPDGSRTELSRESKIVRSLAADTEYRIFIPKEMVEGDDPVCERVRNLVHWAMP